MSRIRKVVLVVVGSVAFASAVATGCGRGGGGSGAGAASATITVSAAASLTESFTEIGAAFEAANPGTTVRFTFDSSSTLARQILDGAPVDVFASADEPNMARLADAGALSGTPIVFARNRLAIVTKPGNPLKIASLADLATVGDGEVIALCGADVPCGEAAATALANAEVTVDEGAVTRGQNAKATLAAVAEGDAAAGIVYVTDARAAGTAVATVDIPDAQNAPATYTIAALADAGDPALAARFAAFVSRPEAQAVLRRAGFLPPP